MKKFKMHCCDLIDVLETCMVKASKSPSTHLFKNVLVCLRYEAKCSNVSKTREFVKCMKGVFTVAVASNN